MAPTTSTTASHSRRQRIIHVGLQQSTTSEETSKSQTSKKPLSKTVAGPTLETKPDYENIHGPLGPLADKLFLIVFRNQMAKRVGIDSDLPKDDYMGLMELTAAMNARFSDRRQVQLIAQDVLRSLFPSWMPPQYKILFSKPFPQFSCRMNAWATSIVGTWLMGETEINDVEIDGGKIGRNQGLLVKRCRFLQESNCASVCVNSCKIPTQNFFQQDMGLPLTMTPDYETFECQFSFGLTPTDANELDAKNTPCLSKCPSSGGMRQWHDASMETSQCSLMDNDNSS
jgi:hypothetical protein